MGSPMKNGSGTREVDTEVKAVHPAF